MLFDDDFGTDDLGVYAPPTPRRRKKVSEFKPWTLEEALPLIREIEPLVRELNYHTCLGGGVLHQTGPRKDLDLFFIPLNGHDSNPWSIVQLLGEVLGSHPISIRDSPDYHREAMYHFSEMRWVEYMGKRIEVFIQ